MKRSFWILFAILVLATALRFFQLDAQSFWNDEGTSARVAERSLPLITAAAIGDIHPPLYYYALHFWRGVFGEGELAYAVSRLFSALSSLADLSARVKLLMSWPRSPPRLLLRSTRSKSITRKKRAATSCWRFGQRPRHISSSFDRRLPTTDGQPSSAQVMSSPPPLACTHIMPFPLF